MKRIIASLVLMTLALLVWICLVSPAMAAQGGSISGRVTYVPDDQTLLNGTMVSLVNGSNVTQYIPGFNTSTGPDGLFQFVNIPYGLYKVVASRPYYFDGYSNGINVITNDTYTAGVVLQAMPYYANITAKPVSISLGGKSNIAITVTDYWDRPVGPGRQILLRSTIGIMEPDSAFTDNDSKVYSSIGYVKNASYAEITAFAIALNGSSYGLEENIIGENATPTAVVSPSVTTTPTVSPTIAPSATVTITPTAIPTPGFELLAALAAIGMALAIWKRK